MDGAGHYLAGVVNCKVEGEGAHQLSYTLLTNTPFSDCLTTMAVRGLGSSQALLEWSATFEADGLPASEAVALLEGALIENCLALKLFMEAGRN